jgi:hypothetical protein
MAGTSAAMAFFAAITIGVVIVATVFSVMDSVFASWGIVVVLRSGGCASAVIAAPVTCVSSAGGP